MNDGSILLSNQIARHAAWVRGDQFRGLHSRIYSFLESLIGLLRVKLLTLPRNHANSVQPPE